MSSVAKTEEISASGLHTDNRDHFFKNPSSAPRSRDNKTTLQYNDIEDYQNQRSHSVGIGLFNTDEIEDLPPRHREKVKNVYKKIVEFANAVIPPEALRTPHGRPIQVFDLLKLENPGTLRSRSHSEASSETNHYQNQPDLQRSVITDKRSRLSESATTNTVNNGLPLSYIDTPYPEDCKGLEINKRTHCRSDYTEPSNLTPKKSSERQNSKCRKNSWNQQFHEIEPKSESYSSSSSQHCVHNQNTVPSDCIKSKKNRKISKLSREVSSLENDELKEDRVNKIKFSKNNTRTSKNTSLSNLNMETNSGFVDRQRFDCDTFHEVKSENNCNLPSEEVFLPKNGQLKGSRKSRTDQLNFSSEKECLKNSIPIGDHFVQVNHLPSSSNDVKSKRIHTNANVDDETIYKNSTFKKAKEHKSGWSKFNDRNSMCSTNSEDLEIEVGEREAPSYLVKRNIKSSSANTYLNIDGLRDCYDINHDDESCDEGRYEKDEFQEPSYVKHNSSHIKNRDSLAHSDSLPLTKSNSFQGLKEKKCSKQSKISQKPRNMHCENLSEHNPNDEPICNRLRRNSSKDNLCAGKFICEDERNLVQDIKDGKLPKHKNNKTGSNRNKFSSDSNDSSLLNNLNKECNNTSNIIEGQMHEPKEYASKNIGGLMLSSDTSALLHILSYIESEQKNIKNERIDPEKEIKRWEDSGFFVNVNVSENSTSLEFWKEFFQNALKTHNFSIDYCCKFTESLILNFQKKEDALLAVLYLKKLKKKTKDLREPHLICVTNLKTRIVRPCNCEKTIVSSCKMYFKEFCRKYYKEHQQKIDDIIGELEAFQQVEEDFVDHVENLEKALSTLEAMQSVFVNQCKVLFREVESSELKSSSIQEIRLLKKRFSQECNSFQRGLPIYSEKHNILEAVRFHPVSIVIADTGSGKSTQLAEYFLGPRYENGTIICTQPRKIAAVSITNYVCGQLGCAVGKLVGYDVGIERKYCEDTKIIYMTDYALLKKILRNRRLRGVSYVIIDEAHERTLYTDLLLGLLKECVEVVPSLRVIITSATIDPTTFVRFFNLSESALVEVPGRTYPVEEIWLENSVEIGWNYVEACVKTAVRIHNKESNGDILVFLTSPSEIDESIIMFKELCPEDNTPNLLSLHGKTDLQEQLLIFDTKSNFERKVIFATNAAETSLTIPGIKYVVDSGMAKELMYFPDKNKSCLMVTFINKSSAEQRKGRAGRTQPGVCYRMYSKKNYRDMPDRSTPEILKTNLSKALLKIFEFGIKLESFQFVETPPEETIEKSLASLEQLGLIKEGDLTDLGRKVTKLPIDPQLSKLVLLGVEAQIGFEAAIIAALVSEAGRLFVRFEDNKEEADKKKLRFCQERGDLCTYLEIYKRWMEVGSHERHQWCVSNCINARALKSAAKTVNEILTCLHQELSIRVVRKYNNNKFNSEFEGIMFNCFSENLCTYSGHPKLGYSSPCLTESLYLHPSSALSYLKKDFPEFLVYCSLLQTSRNFLMNVTPIKKETLDKSCQKGSFYSDLLKCLQIAPKTLGPFGESVLIRHIIGRAGSNMQKLELAIEMLIKSRNFKIDVLVKKGVIVIYLDRRFHDKVSNYVYELIKNAHYKLAKEEEIIKMSPFSYFCIGAGGKVGEIIMPGDYRELILDNVRKPIVSKVETSLRKFGELQSLCKTELNRSFCRINATYLKVLDARSAMQNLAQSSSFSVKSHVYVEESVKSRSLFRMKVSWCRSLSPGSGWIEFCSEADKVLASGRLTRNSVCINNHSICFKPSGLNDKELEMSNLPAVVDESIEEEITELLKGFVEVKQIYIRRRKAPPVSAKGVEDVKKQLQTQLCKFTSKSKLVVEVDYPDPRRNVWSAMVYFEDRKDGDLALNQLQNNIYVNSSPAEIKEVAESHLLFKRDVYEALQDLVVRQFEKVKGSKRTVESLPDETMVKIMFSCKSFRDLDKLRGSLIRLLMGKTIECYGEKKFSFLFTVTGERFLDSIAEKTHTYISVDNSKKSINIYGIDENCNEAEVLIRSQVGNQRLSSSRKKTFDLGNSSLPSGFLKYLYNQYGLDLQKLVKEFKLDDVVLDVQRRHLVFYGNKKQLNLVEERLEEICCTLFEEEKLSSRDSDLDTCAICLGFVPFDYYRLENCGHAFCKSCLLLQIKSSTFPVVCIKENCGKDLFLIDIIKVLTLGSNHEKKSFCNSALQHFVNSNIGKITYCPSPGCNMVCRVSTISPEFHCPECDSDICTRCQTPYHHGMSCELFQNFMKDEDYSLKIWMQEKSLRRKQCPHCSVAIEKESGCNHMECLNCQSHFCWLCLETFPEGKLVYDHLPICPKNQSSGD